MQFLLGMLAKLWEPIASLYVILRLNYEKAMRQEAEAENRSLKRRAELLQRHQELEEERRKREAELSKASGAGAFSKWWHGVRKKGKS